jgi:hypothetical protein
MVILDNPAVFAPVKEGQHAPVVACELENEVSNARSVPA